jgi:hypothetical protein
LTDFNSIHTTLNCNRTIIYHFSLTLITNPFQFYSPQTINRNFINILKVSYQKNNKISENR